MPPGAIYKLLAPLRPAAAGVTGSFFVSMGALAKPNGAAAPYCIANELICATLAPLVFLPVAPAGLTSHPVTNDPLFVMLDFNIAGGALPPADPADCVKHIQAVSAA